MINLDALRGVDRRVVDASCMYHTAIEGSREIEIEALERVEQYKHLAARRAASTSDEGIKLA